MTTVKLVQPFFDTAGKLWPADEHEFTDEQLAALPVSALVKANGRWVQADAFKAKQAAVKVEAQVETAADLDANDEGGSDAPAAQSEADPDGEAQVVSTPPPAEPAATDEKPKLFPACPKMFRSEVDAERDPIAREQVLAKALEDFEGNVAAWNALENTERRSRMQAAARLLHKDPPLVG